MLRGAGAHLYRQISLLAKEPPVEGSPLFLLQKCMETLTDEGLL